MPRLPTKTLTRISENGTLKTKIRYSDQSTLAYWDRERAYIPLWNKNTLEGSRPARDFHIDFMPNGTPFLAVGGSILYFSRLSWAHFLSSCNVPRDHIRKIIKKGEGVGINYCISLLGEILSKRKDHLYMMLYQHPDSEYEFTIREILRDTDMHPQNGENLVIEMEKDDRLSSHSYRCSDHGTAMRSIGRGNGYTIPGIHTSLSLGFRCASITGMIYLPGAEAFARSSVKDVVTNWPKNECYGYVGPIMESMAIMAATRLSQKWNHIPYGWDLLRCLSLVDVAGNGRRVRVKNRHICTVALIENLLKAGKIGTDATLKERIDIMDLIMALGKSVWMIREPDQADRIERAIWDLMFNESAGKEEGGVIEKAEDRYDRPRFSEKVGRLVEYQQDTKANPRAGRMEYGIAKQVLAAALSRKTEEGGEM